MEVNHTVVERATASLFVNNLNLHNCKVCTIGLEAFGVLNGCDLQMMRLTSSLY